MKAWITKTDLTKFRYISESAKNAVLLEQCIIEAMAFDIQPILGAALFQSLVEAVDENDFTELQTKLLEGGAYTYNETTYPLQGVKACLAYYAFSRYTKRDGVFYTATGMVQKNDTLSEPVSDKTRQRLSSEDNAIAEALKLEIIDYLNRNSTSYPLWCCTVKRRKPQMRAIGL